MELAVALPSFVTDPVTSERIGKLKASTLTRFNGTVAVGLNVTRGGC